MKSLHSGFPLTTTQSSSPATASHGSRPIVSRSTCVRWRDRSVFPASGREPSTRGAGFRTRARLRRSQRAGKSGRLERFWRKTGVGSWRL